ncbi:MAG: GNAT family N-acetyltransferase [Acidimicrobiales bacterium]
MELRVEQVPTPASYALRQAVLRPHQGIVEMAWEGDDQPGTATFAAVDSAGSVLGVATVLPQPAPFDPLEAGVRSGAGSKEATWRLRGMATRRDLQGQGIGSKVIAAVVDHVAGQGGDLIWCNARVGAIAFYNKAGFENWGDEFVLPNVGPHVVMWRLVEPRRAP